MNRFVICDDDPNIVCLIENYLNDLYGEICIINRITTVGALIELLQSNTEADVLLLDIELSDYNSIKLVKKYFDKNSALQIVYISGHIKYCTDVYDTNHISFINKPVSKAQLKKAVDKAILTGKQLKSSGIPVKEGRSIHIVMPRNLIYIESKARCLILNTDTGMLEIYEKISTFSQNLPPCFSRCHKSYMVNLERVKSFNGDNFTMDNNSVIPISQTRRKSVREQFVNFVEGFKWEQKC